jgi:iron complex outermembrane recepter protein
VILPIYNQPIGVVERQKEYVHKFNQELRLQSNPGSTLFGHGFDWLVGLYYTDEKTLLSQPIDALDPASPATVLQPALGAASVPADYKEKAGFADFTYHFTQWFDLEAGLRYTRIEQDQTTTVFCCVLFGPGQTFDRFETSENKTTYSVAPRFHITPDTMVYARYATGYRAGGPNLPTPPVPNPPPFGADNTRNYELGIKSDVFDHRFSYDIAVFDIDWTDVQILTLVNTPTGQIGVNGNAGTARNYGVEWNFEWRPVSGLTLGLLGAYINAKVTTDAPLLGASDGDKLPYVPDVTATLNANYTWHAFGSYNAFFGGAWSYVGQQYTNFSTSSALEAHTKLPSYDVLRISTGVDNARYSFEFYAENLANSRGKTDYSNTGGVNQTGLANFIQPRTIGVQVGAKF